MSVSFVKNILYASVAAALSLAACTHTHAQNFDRSSLTKLGHKYTIGFERQVYSVYANRPVQLSHKTRNAEEQCNRLIFRMRLTTRFRIETGLSFRDIDRILNHRYNRSFNIFQPCKLSVPLTIQYQLGSDYKRLRPYFGAGVQYTQQVISANGIPAEPGSKDAVSSEYNNRTLSNLRYMNIIFTQGIIYDINPDLQISQSLHIAPENGIKPIGINIGVGYRIK
ncbi:hypothetical protein GCM10023093_16650 [Nemorincola caseinilytica]|uniref:Outer membrane protein beta-barrel domain-containing protein n=1 Tax=Nemorincola caseinilytica TaxID=2054315 RepID=A0ABP8NEL9_9BACT